jgi:hypothetical protein
MKVNGIKLQEGTLKKVKNLLEDPNRKVQGVFYTNSYFSQRYLSRSHVLVDGVDVEENTVKLTVSTRLEQVGLMEVENTLDKLVQYEAGDLPGFVPEGIMEDNEEGSPHLPEVVSVKQYLYSVDILLILDNPEITYQEFTIAGSKFTLVNLHKVFDEDFEQTVSILFGDVDKMYFYSHFYKKNLSVRDLKMIMDLIMNENITGKALIGIKMETPSKASNSLFPMDSLIDSYTTIMEGHYIFSTGTGYVRIDRESLKDYKLSCIPSGQSGAYQLVLKGRYDTIRFYTE